MSTELWPLIDEICFSLPIFDILPIIFKLCMGVDIGERCIGIADEYISSNNYRVMALNRCSKLRFAQSLLNKWTDFDKIWLSHMHQ